MGRLAQRVIPGALLFAAGVGYCTFGAHASYGLASGSISMWITPGQGVATGGRVFSLGSSVNDKVELAFNGASGNGSVQYFVFVGGVAKNSGVTPGNSVLPNRWFHVVADWGAGGSHLYINGVLVSGTSSATNAVMAFPSSPTLLINTSINSIGASLGGGTYTDVRLYSAVPTAADVKALYEKGANPTTPVATWAFDDLTGSSVALTTGSGNAGTITSGSWSDNVPVTVRESSRNLVLWNEDITNAAWTKSNATTGGTVTSQISGNLTLLTEVAGSAAQHNVFQAVTVPPSIRQCDYVAVSVVVQDSTRQFAYIQIAASTFAFFDLTALTIGSTSGGVTGFIEDIGGGQRLLTAVVQRGALTIGPTIGLGNTSSTFTYAVTAGLEKSIYVGNIVVTTGRSAGEARRRATNYVKTTTRVIWYGERSRWLKTRQNFLPFSDTMTGGAWATTQFTSAAVGFSDPFGGTNAVKLIPNTVSTGHFKTVTVPATSFPDKVANVITVSAWIKDDPSSAYHYAVLSDGVSQTTTFDTRTGAVVNYGASTPNGILTAGSRAYPNGWWRVWLVIQQPARATLVYVLYVTDTPGRGASVWAGDGVGGIFVFGAQANVGWGPNDYVSTGAAVIDEGGSRCVPAPVQYMMNSDDPGVVTWTITGVTATPDGTFAPDGTQWQKVAETATTNRHNYARAMPRAVRPGEVCTAYAIVKDGTRRYVALDLPNTQVVFDLTAATFVRVQTGTLTIVDCGMTSITGGARLLWMTFQNTATTANGSVTVGLKLNDTGASVTASYAGSTANYVYVARTGCAPGYYVQAFDGTAAAPVVNTTARNTGQRGMQPKQNAFPRSDIYSASWTISADIASRTDGQADPNGGTKATRLTEGTANSQHRLDSATVTPTVTGYGRFTLWVRDVDRGYAWIGIAPASMSCDLTTGTGAPSGTAVDGSVRRRADGWCRICCVFPVTAGTAINGRVFLANGTAGVGNVAYVGASKSIDISMALMELFPLSAGIPSAEPGEYVETTGLAINGGPARLVAA